MAKYRRKAKRWSPPLQPVKPKRAKEIVESLHALWKDHTYRLYVLGDLKVDGRTSSTTVAKTLYGNDVQGMVAVAESFRAFDAISLELPSEAAPFVSAIFEHVPSDERDRLLYFIYGLDDAAEGTRSAKDTHGKLVLSGDLYWRPKSPVNTLHVVSKVIFDDYDYSEYEVELTSLAPGKVATVIADTYDLDHDYEFKDEEVGAWLLPQNLSRRKLANMKHLIRPEDYEHLDLLLRATADAA